VSRSTAFDGIWPILFAYFDARGELDRAAFDRQVDAALGWGAPGIAALGLATEVGKLSDGERRRIIGWIAQRVRGAGRPVPIAITIHGETAAAQNGLARFAVDQGASWLIFQPPPLAATGPRPESFYLEFFRQAMQGLTVPTGIQNAPEYLGVGLSAAGIVELAACVPQFRVLKGEAPSIGIRETIDALRACPEDRRPAVLNGRGGLELFENLEAGCAGLIVAPDTADCQHEVFSAWQRGDTDLAMRRYADVLPAIVFAMQSLDTLICYGKRVAALRLGMELDQVHDRQPALRPTAFGLAMAKRHADRLGRLHV
jgi:4-hydroxy-tetrahydrodipicolinate synthase